MRVYIETYGCWLNKADSKVSETLVLQHGHKLVKSPCQANIVVINTCAVRGDTERRMLRRLTELEELRKKYGFHLVVAGCLTPVRGATIHRISPSASILGPNALDRFLEVLQGRTVLDISPFKRRTCQLLPQYNPQRDGIVHVVPIAVGCQGACTFCIEPFIRRYLTSYPPQLIIDNISKAVSRGARLIVLTAQDVAAYGKDLGTNLVKLLSEILSRIEGDFLLRLGMMEPSLVRDFVDELVELYADHRVMKYLHLPLQSGDNKVLEYMNRKYTVEEYNEIVHAFREKFPNLFLATDIIVGFPGEGEREFQNTVRELEKIRPDKVHVARYTLRPFSDGFVRKQVLEPVKKARSQIISKLAEKIALERNKRHIGKVENMIVMEVKEQVKGRLLNFKPVIVEGRASLGQIVKVRIVRATPIDLRGVFFKT